MAVKSNRSGQSPLNPLKLVLNQTFQRSTFLLLKSSVLISAEGWTAAQPARYPAETEENRSETSAGK